MSRARAPSGPSISLFPFLAVLLCTMGALLVLLVLFSRSAKQADGSAEVAARRQLEEELELARDEMRWRLEQVQAVRSRTQADLAKARMQLAGTEETMRAMADELESLERTAAALEDEQPAAADEQIEDLERRLAEARKAVDAAKDATESRPPAYAVVPYEGANGTHRRPLYIECCIDGVFLQPEGIRLGPADFEGLPGPGNPLASALRAAREYIARNPGETGDPNAQPYPLLLVRPSGVMAYYAAREAIQSWGSEFGYQFVDEDWEITYPARDAGLADVEQRAVAEARRRLEWLAQVRPAKPSRPATTYRAATTRGGVVSSGGPSVLGDQSRWDWTEQQATAAQGKPGRGFGGGDSAGSGGLEGDSSGGDAILGGGGGGGRGTGFGGDGAGGPGRGVVAGEPAGVGSRYSGPSKFYSSSDGAAAAGPGSGGPGGGGGPADGDLAAAGSDATAGGQGGGGHGGSRFGGPAGGSPAGGNADGGPGGDRSGGSAAGGSATEGSGSSGDGSGGATSSGGAGGGGGSSFGPSMPGLHQPGGASAGAAAGGAAGGAASLAGVRGSNWASLATQDRPVPLTRPIRLECAAQEFRILGDGGRVQSRIPIGTRTVDSIDPLVREVHATVGRWGIAGDRMYWKPELVLSATADGAERRDDLERLLVDSGIDTRRSGEVDKVRNLPPVQRTGGILKRR